MAGTVWLRWQVSTVQASELPVEGGVQLYISIVSTTVFFAAVQYSTVCSVRAKATDISTAAQNIQSVSWMCYKKSLPGPTAPHLQSAGRCQQKLWADMQLTALPGTML
jgi:hypothetical protein